MSELAPGRTITILVHEWVTGGGLAGMPLPASWAAEGAAIRRAIAADFASLPGVRVLVTLDDRFPDDPDPWETLRIGSGEEEGQFRQLAAEADFTALIAPETGGVLAERALAIDRAGGCSLGSTSEAIAATADKLHFGSHLARLGIATPVSLRVVPADGLPRDWRYPAVLKPIDGTGSMDTFLIAGPDACPPAATALPVALLQPFIDGVPMSASFLIDRESRARLVGVGRQRIDLQAGRFVYRGGTMPDHRRFAEAAPRQAVESVPGLFGFVGVDFLWEEGTETATVLEINPRPTTSCVGLMRLLNPGMLARAWLDSIVGRHEEEGPDLAATILARRPLTFHADGTVQDGLDGVVS